MKVMGADCGTGLGLHCRIDRRYVAAGFIRVRLEQPQCDRVTGQTLKIPDRCWVLARGCGPRASSGLKVRNCYDIDFLVFTTRGQSRSLIAFEDQSCARAAAGPVRQAERAE